MGSKPERGAYGNARGKPDKQRRRRIVRENDPRYQAAMEEVRRNQETIDRLANQMSTEAERSSAARPGQLRYEKPQREGQTIESGDKVANQAVAVVPGRRFAPCHCGHDHRLHEGVAEPACSVCACPYYRPKTAPDPLAEITGAVRGIEELIQHGRKSSNKRTVSLAEKIDALCTDLRERVDAELVEKAEREERVKQETEARRVVAELEASLLEAQQKLRELSGKPATSRKPKPAPEVQPKPQKGTHGGIRTYIPGGFECPTCGDKKDSAQALGAHRARKHGYRKGDDDA